MSDPFVPDPPQTEDTSAESLTLDVNPERWPDFLATGATGEAPADWLGSIADDGTLDPGSTDGRAGWDAAVEDFDSDSRADTVSRDLDDDGLNDLVQIDADRANVQNQFLQPSGDRLAHVGTGLRQAIERGRQVRPIRPEPRGRHEAVGLSQGRRLQLQEPPGLHLAPGEKRGRAFRGDGRGQDRPG